MSAVSVWAEVTGVKMAHPPTRRPASGAFHTLSSQSVAYNPDQLLFHKKKLSKPEMLIKEIQNTPWNVKEEDSTNSPKKGKINFIKQQKYFNYSFGQNAVTSSIAIIYVQLDLVNFAD